MNYLITGGTGFIGKELVKKLTSQLHHVYILTRTPSIYFNSEFVTYLSFNEINNLPKLDAIINLAGESIFGYWTQKKKQRILKSRLEITQLLIEYMKKLEQRPSVFISSSGISYYGFSDEEIFTEATTTPGNDFLANVVMDWESIANQAEALGVRTVLTRFGLILGSNGGALPLMSLPSKLFVGGPLGKGEQWTSWIHIDDVVELLVFAIQNPKITGVLNVTAPKPIRNKDFNQILANTLNRPYWFPTPSLLIRVATGEMSQLVLKGQYVLPNKALENGFTFTYPTLESALEQCFPHVKKF
ncbi:TIGR01777 family oxidoreductase [Ornithinibacillus scapharcae]|uniref:TIGR01777 family oxidoreductase n=1 Tax=Ornithinibacillus scapharcae TaxID=1147159 RepID=UPI000225B8B4|nr:TIGR01777 family oxidoreductase [Ornithinibacillus scapharcae]